MLLLDNCSAHPNEDVLISADGSGCKFLPPNVTTLIQPMDQGVLESLKRRYKRKILEELVLYDERGVSVIDFVRGINLLDISHKIAASWEEITPTTLRLSWRKILPTETNMKSQQPLGITEEVPREPQSHFLTLLSTAGIEITSAEVDEWLTSDELDPGYTLLNDDDIVTEALQDGHTRQPSGNDDDEEDTPGSDQNPDRLSISHEHAFEMLPTL